VATRGNEEVTLDWAEPESEGISGITNYRIYRGTVTGHTNVIAEVGNVLTWTDTGLVNDETYYYNVTAVNAQGEGASTPEVNATPSDRPSAPVNPNATPGDEQITINWQAPLSDGGSPIINYTLYRGSAPGTAILHAQLGNVLMYIDTGLESGQAYYYQISASNANGEGLRSAEVGATPVGPPMPPVNLQAFPGNNFVRLTWAEPVSDGGSAVTNYVVYRSTISGSATLLANVGTVLEYTDTTAVNNVTYYYSVSAVNGNGEGSRTAERMATPSAAPPVEDGGDSTMLILLVAVALVALIAIIVLLPRMMKRDEVPPETMSYTPEEEPEIPFQYRSETDDPYAKSEQVEETHTPEEPAEPQTQDEPAEPQTPEEPTEPQAPEEQPTEEPAENEERPKGEEPRY
jgi:fibronectin type 3 domain-containing protein